MLVPQNLSPLSLRKPQKKNPFLKGQIVHDSIFGPGRPHPPHHILIHNLTEVSNVALTILMLVNQLDIGGTETHVLSLAKQLKKEAFL